MGDMVKLVGVYAILSKKVFKFCTGEIAAIVTDDNKWQTELCED